MKKVRNFFAIMSACAVMAAVSSCGNSASANATGSTSDKVVDTSNIHPEVVATDTSATSPTSATDDTTGPAHRLTFDGCAYPVKIVQGNAFVFPSDLAEFGLTYSRKGDGYVLSQADGFSQKSQAALISVSFTDTLGDAVITYPGGPAATVTITKTGKSNTVKFVSNGVGFVQTDTGIIQAYLTSKGVSKEIVITVPAHTSIGGNATADIRIEAGVDTLNLNASGTAKVYVANAKTISNLQHSGTGSLTVDSSGTIQQLVSTGSSKVSVRTCDSLWNVAAKGSGTVTLASTVKVGNRTTSGGGKIN